MKSGILAFTALALWAQPQQPASPADRLVSPEVSAGRITFRLFAPKAQSVTLNGDWMKLGTQVPMTRDAAGVWSVTAGPLPPHVYLYSFQVDGMTIADPVNPRVKLRARTSASLVEVPGDAPWIHKNVPHGKVEMLTHHSAVLGDVREVYVYTPPGYDANASRRYPVLYLFHGSNDIAAGWTWTGRAHVILDNLIAEGKATPMILVMPWAHAVPFGTPGGKNTEMFERYLVEEIVPLADSKYRTAKGTANRAVAGFSMGASHSLHTGFRHLDLFGNIGLFAGGNLGPTPDETFKAALADTAATNAKLKVFWISIGDEDAGAERNRALRAELRKRGIRFTENEYPGGHFYPVFRRQFAEFAPMVFKK